MVIDGQLRLDTGGRRQPGVADATDDPAAAIVAVVQPARRGAGGPSAGPAQRLALLVTGTQRQDAGRQDNLGIWCERLRENELIGDISAALSGKLQQTGFTARSGKIIDASIVSAPIQRIRRHEVSAAQHTR